ncbi:3-oxoacyl-ACP synthase III family protein [Streptomyces sp. NPDC051567]|uniref:3-oxoacyl-ACP synthase III family protein n=1 Tax=Streptomyces sp. NPDC051567 TaxID=3365660 RepID=UPI0037A1A3BF
MNPATDEPRRPIGIRSMGTYLPSRVRGNREVARDTGVTQEWIVERTGVRTRHAAAPHEAASDMAASAVRAALAAGGLDAADLGLLVCATSTPDELGPSTACRVQHLLGADHAVALDVGAACSGWLFAVKVAHDWLAAGGRARYAAVVGVEAYSKFLDPHDRGTSVLFADGAAAAVLAPVGPHQGFTDFEFGSDGSLADSVLIPGGGSRHPASARTLADGSHHIRMDGRTVSRFIRDVFPRLVRDALARNRLTLDDIACVIAHQPNPVLLRRLSRQLGIPDERFVVVGDTVGNIGAASAPYALATAAARHALTPGDRVLISVFGAGMTWGSALLTWTGAPAVRIRPTSLPDEADPPASPSPTAPASTAPAPRTEQYTP